MGTCYYLHNFPVCLKLFQNEKFKVPDMFYEHMSPRISYKGHGVRNPGPMNDICLISLLVYSKSHFPHLHISIHSPTLQPEWSICNRDLIIPLPHLEPCISFPGGFPGGLNLHPLLTAYWPLII